MTTNKTSYMILLQDCMVCREENMLDDDCITSPELERMQPEQRKSERIVTDFSTTKDGKRRKSLADY